MVWYLMCLGLFGIAGLVALIFGVLFTILTDDVGPGMGVGIICFFVVLAIGAIGIGFFGWGS
jgi:hypothetical protein